MESDGCHPTAAVIYAHISSCAQVLQGEREGGGSPLVQDSPRGKPSWCLNTHGLMGTSIPTAVEEKLQLSLHEISHKDYRLDPSVSLFTSFVFHGCKKER